MKGTIKNILPSLQLQPYIKYYHWLNLNSFPLTFQRSTATTRIILCIPIDIELEFIFGNANCHMHIPFFQGIMEEGFAFRFPSKGGKCLLIEFSDLGFSHLLKVPPQLLTNQLVQAESLIKNSFLGQLTEQLYEVKHEGEIANLVNHFMARFIPNNNPLLDDSITNIVHLLRQYNGAYRVSDMAEEAFLSERQFRRKFTELVGITPKSFAAVIRFTSIYTQAYKKRYRLNWAELAHSFEYHDQMHLIKEFKRFTGFSPTRLPEQDYQLSNRLLNYL